MFFAQNRSRRVPGATLLAGTPGAGVSRRIRATQEFGFQVHRALFLGQAPSLEFLKEVLELAKEVVEAEKGVDPVEERDRAKEALTELFNEAKTSNTHIIVERIVADIDDIVKKVRFPEWQQTTQGERLVQKELREANLLHD